MCYVCFDFGGRIVVIDGCCIDEYFGIVFFFGMNVNLCCVVFGYVDEGVYGFVFDDYVVVVCVEVVGFVLFLFLELFV